MTQAAEELLQQALQLPKEDRDRIAEELWRSIDEPDRDIQEGWIAEAKKRASEIDEGRVKAVPGDKVRENLRSQLVR